MESVLGYNDAKALLAWQIELGATEAIGDVPVNRYELPEKSAKPTDATRYSFSGRNRRAGCAKR